ncbi:MAG: PIN domain-containing protein [Selenomonadales bacterium]|nr:PIN domain-containing protein [Selenomonadales bacterium]
MLSAGRGAKAGDAADLRLALQLRNQYKLSFDDAYQYVAAEKFGYILISLDSDFDRTPKGRRLPDIKTLEG